MIFRFLGLIKNQTSLFGGIWGQMTKKKKMIEKRHFFRREGAIARALARLYHISGTATPIELKFSGMFKPPKKSLNMKN